MEWRGLTLDTMAAWLAGQWAGEGQGENRDSGGTVGAGLVGGWGLGAGSEAVGGCLSPVSSPLSLTALTALPGFSPSLPLIPLCLWHFFSAFMPAMPHCCCLPPTPFSHLPLPFLFLQTVLSTLPAAALRSSRSHLPMPMTSIWGSQLAAGQARVWGGLSLDVSPPSLWVWQGTVNLWTVACITTTITWVSCVILPHDRQTPQIVLLPVDLPHKKTDRLPIHLVIYPCPDGQTGDRQVGFWTG